MMCRYGNPDNEQYFRLSIARLLYIGVEPEDLPELKRMDALLTAPIPLTVDDLEDIDSLLIDALRHRDTWMYSKLLALYVGGVKLHLSNIHPAKLMFYVAKKLETTAADDATSSLYFALTSQFPPLPLDSSWSPFPI